MVSAAKTCLAGRFKSLSTDERDYRLKTSGTKSVFASGDIRRASDNR